MSISYMKRIQKLFEYRPNARCCQILQQLAANTQNAWVASFKLVEKPYLYTKIKHEWCSCSSQLTAIGLYLKSFWNTCHIRSRHGFFALWTFGCTFWTRLDTGELEIYVIELTKEHCLWSELTWICFIRTTYWIW